VPYVTTDRTQFYDSDYRASDLALMSRWGGSGVKAFGLWEYGYGRGFLVPRIPNRELAEAVREGWRRGARGYFAEVEPQWGFDTFKTWMLAQVLWDPERPFEDLAADFYAGYYGAAAGPMRQFFECCEAQWMAQPGPPYWLKFYRQQDQALLFPPETCRKLRGLLAAAARAAGNDAPVAARVALTSRAFAVTDAYVAFDATRRKLAAAEDDPGREAAIAESIGCLVRERAHLEAAFNEAGAGDSPAMAQADLANFVRDDPVPRLLWLAGRRDPSAPRRVLRAAGPEAMGCRPWRGLADAIGGRQVAAAPNLDADSSFAETKPEGQEPRFLFPHSGDVPAGWEVRAMPTESGRVSLVGAGGEAPGRAVRIEGAWDTQIYQWLPAEPGRVYVATARLRGRSSPGNDAALFLTFLDQDGKVAGFRRMASLPKGETPAWRSMALADPAPGGAAWVGIGVGSARQVRGDWFEAARLELRAVKL
jgi:hypothetical protein